MLMRGDFDLNCLQRYADPLTEDLKQTMLNQEVIFKKQVCELHRLYSIQKSLMEDLSWNDFNNFHSWKPTAQSAPKPCANSTKNKILAEERTFSNITMLGSMQSKNQELLEEQQKYSMLHHRLPDFQQRPLDLQLSAEQYVSHVGYDFSKKEKVLDSSKEAKEVRDSLFLDNLSDPASVKLSLSIGEETRKKGAGYRSWFDEKTYSCFQDVIDLEESDEDDKPMPSFGFAAPTNYFGDDLQVSIPSDPVFSKRVKKCLDQGITLVDRSGSSQNQNSFSQGFKECYDDTPSNNQFTQKQQLSSFEVGQLDLNKVQLDDSSCYSNDPTVAYPSTASSLAGEFHQLTSWRALNHNCSNGTSDMHQQDEPLDLAVRNSELVDKSIEIRVRNENFSGSNRSEDVCYIDLESLESADKTEGQATVEAASFCPNENNSSSIKTMQSGIELGDSNLSTSSKFPETPELRSSDSIESKQRSCSMKPAELDTLIQKAAESLLQFSLESPVGHDKENNKKNQPDYSSDSFESITLKLKECDPDDYCMSSSPFEINEMEKKDFGFKLKRGRRLKDFQKDILPGLASLSRHEIREDVNIMEGVMRSREYRKIQASLGVKDIWCPPVRSRRSRRIRKNY